MEHETFTSPKDIPYADVFDKEAQTFCQENIFR